MARRIIAWDFDGVLNRNIVDGAFVWKATFDRDIGVSIKTFEQYIFRSGRFGVVLSGEKDLRDLVSEWLDQSECTKSADEILDYWFSKDALPDKPVIELLERSRHAGFTNVLATNNEARRAAYIEHDMGFGSRLDRIFAAGPMGCHKPDPRFFHLIEQAMDASASDFLLIDDKMENVETARALGWDSFYFEEGDYEGLEKALFSETVS